MLAMKKIFLIGSERSGTNLLRVLLGNHSRISAPPPIHILDLLRPASVGEEIVSRKAFAREAVA